MYFYKLGQLATTFCLQIWLIILIVDIRYYINSKVTQLPFHVIRGTDLA